MARPRSITRATPYTPTRGALAGQTFHSQRQYDNARARLKGFKSEEARRQAPRVVRTQAQEESLRRSEREARGRVLHALSDLRRGEVGSLSEAARRNRTTTAAIKRYAGPALRRGEAGRYRPTRSDSLLRRMKLLTPEGERLVALSGPRASRDASLIARHRIAVLRALEGSDEELLRLRRDHGDRLSALGLESDEEVFIPGAQAGLFDDLDSPYDLEQAAA